MISVLISAVALGSAPVQVGLAANYPDDSGIGRDPEVLFHDDFEHRDLLNWNEKKGPVVLSSTAPNSGKTCVEIPMNRGQDTGGHLLKWFRPGADTVYARFYVKFSKGYQYCHHFVWLLANPPEDKWKAFGKAGLKPDGSYFSTAMEPNFAWGKDPPAGRSQPVQLLPGDDGRSEDGQVLGQRVLSSRSRQR